MTIIFEICAILVGESETEEDAAGHYEAIYEVISPNEGEEEETIVEQDEDDEYHDDHKQEAYSTLCPLVSLSFQFLDFSLFYF